MVLSVAEAQVLGARACCKNGGSQHDTISNQNFRFLEHRGTWGVCGKRPSPLKQVSAVLFDLLGDQRRSRLGDS